MDMSRYWKFVVLLVLFSIPIGIQLGLSQPPPPPPPNGPPCWPPPCVPVDGGILAAVGAAALFGGKKLIERVKSKIA